MRPPAVELRLVSCTLVVVAASLLCGGCALIDQKVPLNYGAAPQSAGKSVDVNRAGAAPVRASAGGTIAPRGAISIARPAEPTLERNKKGQPVIGTVRNGYGMETATSVTEDSVGEWVAGAFAAELNAAGYSADVVDKLPYGCPRGIELDITRIWVDQDAGWWTVGGIGDLQFRMTVVRNGSPVQQLELTGKGQHRGAFGDTGPKARALEKALQQCVRKAMPYVSAATKG